MSTVQIWVRRSIVLLILGIAAGCGGGGGSGASSPTFGGPSKVFAADEVNGAVGSTDQGNPAAGTTIAITRILSGPNTLIPPGPPCFGCLPSLALDSGRDQLYVSSSNGVLVFNNAGTVTGNVAPARQLSGLGTGLGRHIQLDTTTDRLYVSTGAGGQVLRLDNASTAAALTPASRILSPTPFFAGTDSITDIALDATHDVLYVGLNRNGAGKVGIILNVSTRTTGNVPLDSEIAVTASTPSITVDGPKNILYVSGLQSAQILVFDNASALSGTPTPRQIQQLPAVTTQYRLFVETTNDRLYASGMNRVVIINGASTATTAVGAAVAQLSTMNSDLTAVVARP